MVIGKLLNPELWKSTVIFAVGWIVFFAVLNFVQNNGSFMLTFESTAIVFVFALGYNLVLSLIIPGRFK